MIHSLKMIQFSMYQINYKIILKMYKNKFKILKIKKVFLIFKDKIKITIINNYNIKKN